MSQHTPGPWRWEFNAEHKKLTLVGGVPRYDLTVVDFERWGMNGATMRLRDTAHDGMNIMYRVHERPDWIAPEKGREHHKSWHQLLTHPDARLIAAAPDLLEALSPFVVANSSEEYITLVLRTADVTRARAAIAKATGGNQAMTQPGDTLTQREAGLVEEMIDLVSDLARGNTEVATLEARAHELIGRLP